MKKLAVVAFGGNALLRGNQKGTIEEQAKNANDASKQLFGLLDQDYNLVVTHGNGPQVGNILLANSAGNQVYGVPDMPLDIAVAYSQGFIGYVIEQQLGNEFKKRNIEKDIITLVTQVVVDKNDPAFENPTKPIGPFYTKEDADKAAAETGSIFKEDAAGRGWRKVVASPKPLEIKNKKTVETLAREGNIVITAGGGGVPVFHTEDGLLQGIDSVIDKDLASSLLAVEIGADEFFILTDVSKVCLNFNTPEEKKLDTMTIAEAHELLNEGQFGEGSMAPKVRAAVGFVERTGRDAIITATTALGVEGEGTRIIKG
ncbi:MAG: carbamate kinase [Hyphomicrobiales bacterium]